MRARSAAGFSRVDGAAGDGVHRRGPGQHRVDVDPLEGGRQEPDRAQFARAPADPVPHREPGEPALLLRELVELRARSRDGDVVRRVGEARRPEGGGGLELPVAGLRGASRLGDHHHEGAREVGAEARQHIVHPVGVRVVEELDLHPVPARLAERVAHELRAQGRAADSDDEQVGEPALGAGDGARVHLGGEVPDRGERGRDLLGYRLVGGELRGPQPVVAHHALLARVRDRALLQGRHVGEGPLDPGLHRGEVAVGERARG